MAHFHIFIWYANKIVEFPGSKRNLLLRLPVDLPMDLDPLAGDHLAAVTEVEVNSRVLKESASRVAATEGSEGWW